MALRKERTATEPAASLLHGRRVNTCVFISGFAGSSVKTAIRSIAAFPSASFILVTLNWYSFRHALDFLLYWFPDRVRSELAALSESYNSRQRRSLSNDLGSRTTMIYQRKKLKHLEPSGTGE
jgi:hypothetical protein